MMRIAIWIGAILVALAVIGAIVGQAHRAPSAASPSPQTTADAESSAPAVVKPLKTDTEPAASRAHAAQAPSTPSSWRYNETRDEMRGKATKFACTTSDNELNFDFPYSGGATAELCLRIDPKFGKDVILSIDKGQFMCSMFECSVSVKFDDGSIQTFSAVDAADGKTNLIFIRNYGRFVASLRKARHLIIEANFFQEGRQQMKFTVGSLEWS